MRAGHEARLRYHAKDHDEHKLPIVGAMGSTDRGEGCQVTLRHQSSPLGDVSAAPVLPVSGSVPTAWLVCKESAGSLGGVILLQQMDGSARPQQQGV